MAINYPNSLDNFTNPTSSSPINSPSHSEQHANANDAIEAIEGELGTNPKGAKATVKARLDDVDTAIATKAPITSPTFTGTVTIPSGSAITGVPYLATANTFTTTQTITPSSTTAVNLVLKATAGQTSDLMQLQNQSGSVISYIDSNAIFNFTNNGTGASSYSSIKVGGRWIRNEARLGLSRFGVTTGEWHMATDPDNSAIAITDSQVGVFATSTTLPLFTVKAMASQTANLQEWQSSSGTVLAKVANDGGIYSISGGFFGTVSAPITSGNYLAVRPWAANHIPFTVKGFTAQTGDLTRWVNDAGTTLASITSNGGIQAGTYNGVVIGLNYPGIVIDTSNADSTQVWLRNLSATSKSGKFVGIKARNGYADAVAGDDLVTLEGQQYISSLGYASGKILISNDDSTPSATSYPARITFHTTAIGSTTLSERMRVDNAGLVGINMTPTDGYLSVTGSSSKDAIRIYSQSGLAFWGAGANNNLYTNGNMYMTGGVWAGYTKLAVDTGGASKNGIVVRGSSLQTANLQEWQNSSGTVLAAIEPNGSFYGSSITAYGILTNNSSFRVNNASAGTVATIIKGAASQTANLQEWQNSAGTVLASIGSGGVITSNIQASSAISTPIILQNSAAGVGTGTALTMSIGGLDFVKIESAYATSPGTGGAYLAFKTDIVLAGGPTLTTKLLINNQGTVTVNGFVAGAQGLIVKGAASQTANLQEWQDSAGTVIASIGPAGDMAATQLKSSGDIRIQSGSNLFESSNTGPYLNFGSSALTVNHRGVTTTTSFIVKGMASQTANLQEWQNSAGAALAKVDASGNIIGSNLYYTYTLPDTPTGGVNWMLLGTWSTIQNGSALKISIDGKTGYNAQKEQLWNSELYFVTSNDDSTTTALDSNVFYGNGLAYRNMDLGSSILNADPRFRVLQNSKTSYSIYIKAYQWLGRSAYKVSFSQGTSWLNSSSRYGDTAPTGTVIEIIPTPSLSSNGGTGIIVDTTTKIGLFIKSAPSQTANLQEWQNSASTVLASISKDGVYSNQYGVTIAANVVVGSGSGPTGYPVISLQNVSSAPASNPANGGNIYVEGGSLKFRGSGGITAQFEAYSATDKPIVIKGFASQTANLQEWQNSAGTVLAKVDSAGMLVVGNTTGTIQVASSGSSGAYPSSGSGIEIVAGALSGVDLIQSYNRNAGTWRQLGINTGKTTFSVSGIEALTITSNSVGFFNPTVSNVAMGIIPPSATAQGIVVRAFSGQSANLQEWQNSSANVSLAITPDGSIKGGRSSTISANTATTVDTVALSSFTTIEYTISIKQGSKVRSSKVLVHTDGTSIDSTEYGIMEMGGGITGILVTASVSSTNSILQVTITDAATTNATVKLIKTML